MSRWRAPSAKSSAYITRDGAQRLETELKGLWERRADVTRHLAAAAAEGDRSENAEYIYRKKELREIDRRIRYLQKRLPILTVVSQLPSDRSKVFFGAWVTLENESGDTCTYRIVGPDEIDPAHGWISMDSPMARALLKKNLDDEITVTTPAGLNRWLILGIRYD